jgi:hypothetical protein
VLHHWLALINRFILIHTLPYFWGGFAGGGRGPCDYSIINCINIFINQLAHVDTCLCIICTECTVLYTIISGTSHIVLWYAWNNMKYNVYIAYWVHMSLHLWDPNHELKHLKTRCLKLPNFAQESINTINDYQTSCYDEITIFPWALTGPLWTAESVGQMCWQPKLHSRDFCFSSVTLWVETHLRNPTNLAKRWTCSKLSTRSHSSVWKFHRFQMMSALWLRDWNWQQHVKAGTVRRCSKSKIARLSEAINH